MDSVLSPREIQTRIRSGASLDDVVEVAGLPRERVERFAAPVLAEREHVAAQARSSFVRRRGETSGHRTLRAVLGERLRARGVDIDSVGWDSHRLENGRWAVSAVYELGGENHEAVFHFDLQGRFSLAANDDARWVLGESGRADGPAAAVAPDTEPTIDLSDDLAIVRAVQEPPVHPAAQAEAEVLASVQPIRPTAAPEPRDQPATGQGQDAPAVDPGATAAEAAPTEGPDGAESRPPAEPSPIDTLYEMLGYEPLGGDGYSEDSPRVYSGLSAQGPPPDEVDNTAAGAPAAPGAGDPAAASAPSPAAATQGTVGAGEQVPVPESVATRGAGWEPAIVVAYPVEPQPSDDGEPLEVESPEASDDPARPEPPVAIDDRYVEAEALEDEQSHHRPPPTDHPAGTDAPRTAAAAEPPQEEGDALIDAPAPAGTPKPAGRRRRASVPSWDEIMFGGPRKPN